VADIDDFATSLLEEAKRFLEKAQSEAAPEARNAYLHAAMLLAFCSLEAHINAISDDFSERPEFSIHERSILLELEVRLEDGEFSLGGLKIFRLEDRLQFLHRKFSGKPFDKSVVWWAQLKNAMSSRNKLTHPKDAHLLTVDNVRDAIAAITAALDATYSVIYKKNFPAANRGLQ
jgi:hypothetical protein